MSRNPDNCPHNVTEQDSETGEVYCEECGLDLTDTDAGERAIAQMEADRDLGLGEKE